jgi:hypothetical protein
MAQRISCVTLTRVNANASEMLKVGPVTVVNSITTASILEKAVHHATVIKLVLSISHAMM